MLLLMKDGEAQQELSATLGEVWKMSTEVKLEAGMNLSFLGLEVERNASEEICVHQTSFIKNLLIKHGLKITSKSIQAVTMAFPGADDLLPAASEFKQIQVHAGELNCFATRTRADLA